LTDHPKPKLASQTVIGCARYSLHQLEYVFREKMSKQNVR